MTIFATRGQGMKLGIDENFIAKKIQNFEENIGYVHHNKTKNMQISDSGQKSMIF